MIDPQNTAIVQQAEETERELIDRAIASLSQSNWDVGECASKWTSRFARGRTDDKFGELIGLSRSQVQKCRQLYDTYGDVRDSYPSLKFSHFYLARDWPDAEECLAWAEENQASTKEMLAWRRMNGGEDDVDENDHFATSDDEEESCHSVATSEPDGIAEGFEDAESAGEADPYQKPPSTVVSTPRDFETEPEKPAETVEQTELRDVLTAIRAAVKMIRRGAESRVMAFELRKLADEIEDAARKQP